MFQGNRHVLITVFQRPLDNGIRALPKGRVLFCQGLCQRLFFPVVFHLHLSAAVKNIECTLICRHHGLRKFPPYFCTGKLDQKDTKILPGIVQHASSDIKITVIMYRRGGHFREKLLQFC